MSKRKSRGGARQGSGRKPAGTVQVVIRPLKQTAARLKSAAKAQKKTLGQVVDKLMEESK